MTHDDVKLLVEIGALAIAYIKWQQEMNKHSTAQVERFTRVETKVDILYKFWEVTMERRSNKDQVRYITKNYPEDLNMVASEIEEKPNGEETRNA